jgi:hypothetical protein
VPTASEAISWSYVPPNVEAPLSGKVPRVKGVTPKDWFGAQPVFTTKATNVTTKMASAISKAADVATKAASAVSCCHRRRWSERQTQRNRRHRRDIS